MACCESPRPHGEAAPTLRANARPMTGSAPSRRMSWKIALPRLVHAFAKALDQPQHPRRPAVAIAAQGFHDSHFDRIDQCCRLCPQPHDKFIEGFEPLHLQEFRPRHVEDESRDATPRNL